MIRPTLALAALLVCLSPSAGAQTPAAPAPPATQEPPPATPAAPAAPAPATPAEPAPSAKPPLPRGAILEEVSGTVRDVDRKAHKLAVDTPTGGVTLSLDRNTMVYTAAGLGTVLDVKPGAQIRAGRNADFLAYWVQVRGPPAAVPPSTPGQGTGPAGGGSAPAGEPSGPGTGPAPSAPTTAPGGAPPGAGGAGGTPPGG